MKHFYFICLMLISTYSFSSSSTSNRNNMNDVKEDKESTSPKSTTSLPDLEQLKNFFRVLQDESWKNKIMTNSQGQEITILEYLIKTINLRNDTTITDLETIQKNRYLTLTNKFPLDVAPQKNFWNERYISRSHTNAQVFSGEDRANYNNNPTLLQLTLNMRQLIDDNKKINIFNIQNPQTPILAHSNFRDDDVIRALSLSGTFCELKKSGNRYSVFEPIFSGMLVEDQFYDQETFAVHTCLHGFIKKELSDIYFVPYGIDLNDTHQEPNISKSLQVIFLAKNTETEEIIQKNELLKISEKHRFSDNDYITAYVQSPKETSLKQILQERATLNLFECDDFFPGFFDNEEKLPNFLGNDSEYNEKFKNFSLSEDDLLKRIYLIGHPSRPELGLDESGFTVATNLTPIFFRNARQSLRADPDIFTPPYIGYVGRLAVDVSCYKANSGGIFLISIIINKGNITLRLARSYGTLCGEGRRFSRIKKSECIDLNTYVNVFKTTSN